MCVCDYFSWGGGGEKVGEWVWGGVEGKRCSQTDLDQYQSRHHNVTLNIIINNNNVNNNVLLLYLLLPSSSFLFFKSMTHT